MHLNICLRQQTQLPIDTQRVQDVPPVSDKLFGFKAAFSRQRSC